MTFTIVTPCLNAERFLRDTMESVLGQRALRTGEADLEYLICDGGSSDRTLEIAESFHDPRVRISSMPDNGMYEALVRGLRIATGDVLAYLNAGDLYYPTAFQVVMDVMSTRDVRWLTGYNVGVSEDAVPVFCALPPRYRRRLFECGAYGRTLLPPVQQESTFWRRSLMEHVDLERLATFRLAGDAFLWQCFSRHTELSIAASFLGMWRVHAGQLSSTHRDVYLAELSAMSRRLTPVDHALALVDKCLWSVPRRVQKWLNPHQLLLLDHTRGEWG